MKKAPKTIIISGTTRNVGKTTFACQLIEKYKSEGVTAIKISPHFHNLNSDADIIFSNNDFIIIKEHNFDGNKDSSRMLNAGAKEVFFIMTKDENLDEIVNYLFNIIDINTRIIIESAAIRRYIEPVFFYLLYNDEYSNIKHQNIDLDKFVDLRINSKDIL
ncbi:MAG: hypothetical protein DRI86_11635 [Bacteroidetes bacterium]|nr:MAG: hypothetical protein DRI86_11635 [Bacteroidota bacterium]